MGTGTDSLLMTIHHELAAKLEKAVRKPLFITVTYLDEANELQHWQCTNNDFADADIAITLNHLLKQAEEKSKPNPVVINLHKQFRAKMPKRGLRG